MSAAIEVSGYDVAAASRFRSARFSHFLALISSIKLTSHPLKILDVGGVASYWNDKRSLINRPVEITLLNLEKAKAPDFISLAGDARSMDFPGNSFDVVHSNSVIEHVGQWKDMMAMAKEVRRVAPAYFVQTPYYWFPIEPHTRTPFFHWLPDSLKFRLAMAKKLGPFWGKCESIDEAMRAVHSAILLDKRMFAALFPNAKIVHEKFMGLTKSLIAIKESR